MFKILLCSVVFAANAEKTFEALGHMIGRNLQELSVPVDMEAVAKGLLEASRGQNPPLSEEECVAALASMEREQKLRDAVAFLQENQKKENVVSMVEGKLQFEILRQGEGDRVEKLHSPLLRLTQEIRGERSSPLEQVVSLEEAFPGLQLGVLGMREGEVRKLYIHPELCEDLTEGDLLTIEVSVMQVESPPAHRRSAEEDVLLIR